MIANVGRAGDNLNQFREVCRPSNCFKFLPGLEPLSQRDVIDDFARVSEFKHRLKDFLMGSAVEVVLDQQLHRLRHRGVIEQDCTEHRLLCFQVLWRELGLREIN